MDPRSIGWRKTHNKAVIRKITATNFSGDTIWGIVNGVLPVGLGLSSAGLISGTPTVSGTSVFTIEVKDKIWSDSKEFSVEVVPEIGIVFSFLFSVIGLFFAMRRV